MTPHDRLLVGWLVGLSLCHYFLKGRQITLSCFYRSVHTLTPRETEKGKSPEYFKILEKTQYLMKTL